MSLDYVTGAKIDELSTKLDRIIELLEVDHKLMEVDLLRKYPDLKEKKDKD